MIEDRLRTDNWSNESHPTGVVKQVYGIPTFPFTFPIIAKAVYTVQQIVEVRIAQRHYKTVQLRNDYGQT